MLEIVISGDEMWDEQRCEFITDTPKAVLHLEHSLYAIALWESKWQKHFVGNQDITNDELMDYFSCMGVDGRIDDIWIRALSPAQIREIVDYMNNPMSATTFSDNNQNQHSNEIVTTELIYYWMAAAQIPFSCDRWHFNRLMNLIHIAGIKSQPPKKMSKREIMSQNAALNRARRSKYGSKG